MGSEQPPQSAVITADQPPGVVRKAIAASAIGNATEWFDYGIYAYCVTYISAAIFPGDTGTATLLALMTISPDLSSQFGALVNLAVVTNVVPYILALTALTVILQSAGVVGGAYTRSITITIVGVLYSVYALFAAGLEAVMGGMLVMGLGWLIWLFMAPRFMTVRGAATARAA